MPKLSRIFIEWCAVCAGLLVLVCAAVWGHWLWRADLSLHDWAQTKATQLADADVVIIAIDDSSLSQIGRWPWPRTVHAAMLDRLTSVGVRAIGLDLIFSEPSPEDAALSAAIERNGNVVLAINQREEGGQIVGENPPVPMLAQVARALGHIQVEFDPDGLARSLYLHEGWEAARHPQLSLAMLQIAGEAALAPMPEAGFLAWHRREWFRIPFVGPPGSFTQYSYVDVLSGAVPAEKLQGKFILVGAVALGLADSVPVPTSAFGRPMAGVEVHANALAALRNGQAISLAPPYLEALYAALVVLLLMWALRRSQPHIGLIWVAGVTLVLILLSLGLMRYAHYWLGPSAALLACVLAYPLWSWRRLAATQRYIDQELQRLETDAVLPRIRAGAFDPLHNRLQGLRRVAQQARAAQQAREDMMGFVSHDVRAPLASIVSLADYPPEDGSAIPKMRAYAESGLHLVDQMFRIARAEVADSSNFREFDLLAVIEEACDAVWALARKTNTTVVFARGDLEEATMLGSAELIRRALGNLLSNAIKYGGQAGPVSISLSGNETHWTVTVRDQGPGIPKAQRSQLFRRFSRLPDAKARGIDGIGLGLMMVAVVAERHQGSASVDCPEDGGSAFSLHLPRTGLSEGALAGRRAGD